MSKELSCKQRWAKHKNSTISDLRRLWRAYCKGQEEVKDLGNIYEYGLSFDYVAPDTFSDQHVGYWRYQISWGGPSEEFRFFSDGPTFQPHKITFVFMDWFDGYGRKLVGKDLGLMLEIWNWFEEMDSVRAEYDKAVNEY